MAFWSTNFGEDTSLKDPKRKFRFTVSFTGVTAAQGGAVLWYAKTCDKPGFTIESAEHKYLNHTFWYPGSVSWNEINMTLVDPADPDVAATLSDVVTASGYKPPTDATNESMTTMSKAKSAGALGTVIITQIDAEGKPLEQWTLWNGFITEVNYGQLEYGGNDLTELTVKLRYDWARVETPQGKSAGPSGGNEFFGVRPS